LNFRYQSSSFIPQIKLGKSQMKKIFLFFALLIITLSTFTCNNENLEAKGSPEYFEEI